jgi:hypothetical protein
MVARRFEYFGTDGDAFRLLEAILGTGEYVLVPDMVYEEPQPVLWAQLSEEAKAIMRQWRRGFLWSDRYAQYPPIMKQLRVGKSVGKYMVNTSEGGPFIMFHMPACYEKGGITWIDFGYFDYPLRTFHPGTYHALPRSSALRESFRRLKRLMQRQFEPLRVLPEDYLDGVIWMGAEGKHWLEEGRVRLAGGVQVVGPA